MRVTLRASTGTTIEVWEQGDVLHAQRMDRVGGPQTCLPIDLFEVIAELAGLELDQDAQAREALRLAEETIRCLKAGFTVELPHPPLEDA